MNGLSSVVVVVVVVVAAAAAAGVVGVVVVGGGGGGLCFSVRVSSGIPPWLLLGLHLFWLSETQTLQNCVLENFDHLRIAT